MNIRKLCRRAVLAAMMLHAGHCLAATSSIVTIPGATVIGTCSGWTGLGAGPLRIFTGSNTLSYAISDVAPVSTTYLIPLAPNAATDVPTTSNVWLCNSGTQSPVTVRVAPLTAPAGSGYQASGRASVTGSFASAANCGTGTSASYSASFSPLAGRSFNISGYGTFVATLQLERSFDGTTWLPITAAGVQLYKWTSPFSETDSEDEVGVLYHLNCTSYTSGTANYRLEQ